MDLGKIRSMSDEELTEYLNKLANSKNSKCAKCKSLEPQYNINVQNKEKYQTKKLCGLCENCYKELLQYLQIEDIDWKQSREKTKSRWY